MAKLLQRIPRREAKAILFSLVIGIALTGLKFTAYFLTHSAAIFADALENIVNIVAACVAWYSLVVSHTPADEDHPYGHGKIEFLSAATEGGMVLVVALLIGAKAVENLTMRKFTGTNLHAGLLLSAVAMLVNGLGGYYLMRVGRKGSSATLVADGKHLFADAITSAAAIFALVGAQLTGIMALDPIIALIVAIYIVYVGLQLIREAAAGLMDKQDVRDTQMLTDLLDSHVGPDGKQPRICGYHKLRHRHSGRYHWVDFHIIIPATFDVESAHNIASAIEFEIENALHEGNATAHVEPCIMKTCPTCTVAPIEVPPPPPSFSKGNGGEGGGVRSEE